MNGKYLSRESWEKQKLFKLDNGCKVTIEYNSHYGEFVARIDDELGYWHCSDNLSKLPPRFAWALEWAVPIRENFPEEKWIVPKFNRVY